MIPGCPHLWKPPYVCMCIYIYILMWFFCLFNFFKLFIVYANSFWAFRLYFVQDTAFRLDLTMAAAQRMFRTRTRQAERVRVCHVFSNLKVTWLQQGRLHWSPFLQWNWQLQAARSVRFSCEARFLHSVGWSVWSFATGNSHGAMGMGWQPRVRLGLSERSP